MSNPLDPTTPFRDSSEMIAAIRDPRYASYIYPNHYREIVEAKIGLSEGIGTDSVRDTTSASLQRVGIGSDRVHDGPSAAADAEDEATARQQFAELQIDHPMALPPDSK